MLLLPPPAVPFIYLLIQPQVFLSMLVKVTFLDLPLWHRILVLEILRVTLTLLNISMYFVSNLLFEILSDALVKCKYFVMSLMTIYGGI